MHCMSLRCVLAVILIDVPPWGMAASNRSLPLLEVFPIGTAVRNGLVSSSKKPRKVDADRWAC